MSGTRRKSTAARSEPERKKDGTFARGVSGNPGGLSREGRELRRWCQEKGQNVRVLLDEWMGSGDFRAQRAAVEFILVRGFGLPVKASELPDAVESPVPTPEECSTPALLAQTRALLARGVANLSRKVEAGEVGPEDMAALGRVGHSLGELLKVEKEAEARSGLAEKSIEELLTLIPDDVLVNHLRKRDTGIPEVRNSVGDE